jgi:hypothetical protein
VVAEPRRIGVSVSESADLHRLGLDERHLRLALGEVGRVVIRAGHFLVYGGHLDPEGYTAFLEFEMDRYGRTDRPLQLVVGWSEHRRLTLTELRRHKENLQLKARITYLDAAGAPIAVDVGRGQDPEPVADVPAALTALRRYLVSETDARVLIGGREHDYHGEMPGIVEEALLAIEAGSRCTSPAASAEQPRQSRRSSLTSNTAGRPAIEKRTLRLCCRRSRAPAGRPTATG